MASSLGGCQDHAGAGRATRAPRWVQAAWLPGLQGKQGRTQGAGEGAHGQAGGRTGVSGARQTQRASCLLLLAPGSSPAPVSSQACPEPSDQVSLGCCLAAPSPALHLGLAGDRGKTSLGALAAEAGRPLWSKSISHQASGSRFPPVIHPCWAPGHEMDREEDGPWS